MPPPTIAIERSLRFMGPDPDALLASSVTPVKRYDGDWGAARSLAAPVRARKVSMEFCKETCNARLRQRHGDRA